MRRILLLLLMPFFWISCDREESLDQVIERGLDVSRQQAACMAARLEGMDGRLPRTFDDGEFVTADCHWWTAGFFPGVLWQLYADSRDPELLAWARLMTDRVEPVKTKTDTHDLGFMLHCSFGQGYKLLHEARYREVLETGIRSLLTRWNPELGVIKSWESSPRWKYPVIIDNMMNLEYLCFMARETGEGELLEVAKRHADTTLKNHFRDDGSSYHLVSYDPETGEVQVKNTVQGYADDSAWARGQAWGLYGYTMMFRETGEPRYLEQARTIARFLVHHPRLPEDKIPYWDFDDPGIPDVPRDASAGAIMASTLIELSTLDPTEESALWRKTAEVQLRSLTSERYLAAPGTNGGFILMHSTGNLPSSSEVDVPLTYADYYYVEALLRMKALLAR